jgi:hypothetical protein
LPWFLGGDLKPAVVSQCSRTTPYREGEQI